MIRFARLAAAAALLALAPLHPAAAQELPRRAFLGVAMAPGAQTGEGAVVTALVPGGTAEALGLRAGDAVVAAGGAAVAGPADLVRYAQALDAGAPVRLSVRRAGRTLNLAGRAAARPLERYDGAEVRYGAVPWGGGHLRDILTLPAGAAAPPVVFFIQGYSCATIEAPDPASAYAGLAAGLLREGIGFYRVEKPGIGDSRGTAPCSEMGYEAELDAFRAAYRHLISAHGVEPARIFMLGHSLGGLQAPMLAAEQAPRGVAVYGTVLRNWADYHRDMSVLQPFLIQGRDPGEAAQEADRYRDLFRLFYHARTDPRAIAAADPALAAGLRAAFNWDGGTRVFGRHFSYAQDLAHQPLIAAWRGTRAHILSMYGGSDMVALTDMDHKLIVEIANDARPGSARYVEFAETGHGMDLIGTRQQVREATRSGTPPAGRFNPEVPAALARWIRDVLASPPLG
jgi:dienelactone hydrolase